jgi:predicted dehydrogenase
MDSGTTLTLEQGGESRRVPFEVRDMLADELAAFGRCARTSEAPETGAEEGIAALRVILGVLSAPRGAAPAEAPGVAR